MKSQTFNDPRKRKLLLFLPLIMAPFITMAFWALGGGKPQTPEEQRRTAGLNLELPNAQLKDDKGENKLSYYEEAEKDSAKWRQRVEEDPFLSDIFNDSIPKNSFVFKPYPLKTDEYKDPNERKVYQKLADLNRQLQDPKNFAGNEELNAGLPSDKPSLDGSDVNRLEAMMKAVTSPGTKDPQVEQLNDMMDRILDIQHPELVKQRLTDVQSRNKTQQLPVQKNTRPYSVSLLGTFADTTLTNSFYGLDINTAPSDQNAIEAVIHETQVLVDGSIVKLRLLNDITLDGLTITKGKFVFGKASLQGERLHIEVSTLRKGNSLLPVSLTVYDLDGMEGIHIPGAITRDVAKTAADNSLQNFGVNSYDPSFKAQATSAGINAAKSFLSRKARLVKVTVKAGYKILLKGKDN